MQYEVPGMTLIPQQLDWSCWYASAQMLIQWKQDSLQQSLADLVPPDLDAMCRRIRDDNQGITNPQIMDMAQRLGLAAVPPVCPTPSAISGWLQDYGPLWVNGQTHIVVIAGINGLNVKVYDPSPKNVGGVDWRSLQTWYEGSDVDSGDISDGVQAVFLYCP
jgi:ABC-type bacteriocin/lantibiotic exporter with double-glycine peptidase domain